MGLICPICMGVVKDPVKDKCGHVYGKHCIKRWLAKSELCPLSRCPISKGLLKDNHSKLKIGTLSARTKTLAVLLVQDLNIDLGAPPVRKAITYTSQPNQDDENKENIMRQ